MGPGTFLTSAVAGATYGYSLTWALALALLFRFVWVDVAASYVLVTRESLLQGYARIGRWLVWTALTVTVLVRHSTNLYTVLLMGNAAHLLLPLPFAASGAIWSVGLTLLGVGLMIGGGYPLIERICTIVIVILGVSLPIAGAIARPDPVAIANGLFIPTIPNSTGLFSSVLLISAMIGAQAGSMSNLSYSYFASERGWSGVEDLPRQRLDLLASTACRFGIGMLLQVTAAATILPLGLKPGSAEELVRIFSESMGLAGRLIFGLGLWGICFSSFIGGTMGYSLIVRDICRRYVPGLRVAVDSATLAGNSRHDRVYKWSVAILGLSPLYIVFLSVEPVMLTLIVRSMVVIVIPVLVGSLIKISNDRVLMGAHRPSVFSNVVMALLVVVSLYLTVRDSSEWWRMLFG